MSEYHALKVFLNPGSVAVIGVSRRTGPDAYNPVERMVENGYQGRIYPVNPNATEIFGRKCYAQIKDIPEGVDLALICTPRDSVLKAVSDCAAKGIRHAIVIAQGFADADDIGRKMQEKLVSAAQSAGMRIIGPNTLGIVNLLDHFYTPFANFGCTVRPIGVICQSGFMQNGADNFYSGMAIGVDLGNTCDVAPHEMLQVLSEDPRIHLIAVHLEGLSDGRAFMETAKSITGRKPIVVLKSGRSESGARAAASHSGQLAGEDAAYTAAFDQCGVFRVRSVEELYDVSRTLLTYSGIRGTRLAIITASGGAGIMAMDAMEENGFRLATLSRETVEYIAELSPQWLEIRNPIDIWPAAMKGHYPSMYPGVLAKVLADDNVDGVLCISFANQTAISDVSDALRETAKGFRHKPVLGWFVGQGRESLVRNLERDGNVLNYPSPERALNSLRALRRHTRQTCEEPSAVVQAERPRKKQGKLVDSRRKASPQFPQNGSWWDIQAAGMELLRHYDISVARWRFVRNEKEAGRAAAEIGYPLVAKIISAQAAHKSDVGGVRMGLRTVEELQGAIKAIRDAFRKAVSADGIEGYLIQEQLSQGLEVFCGFKRDPQFGPVVLYGRGGVETELYRDVALGIAPLDEEQAFKMVSGTKSYQLLKGFRGKEGGDIEAVVRILMSLSRLALDFAALKELDMNPVKVSLTGAVVVDARFVLG